MKTVIHLTDQIGREVSLPSVPQRLVSLCPSLTETLYALGLGPRVVGRTRFCIHPAAEVSQAVRVGGTKEVKFDRLHALTPDLIICEKEENTPDMVEALTSHYPVYVGDVKDVATALALIEDLGILTDTQAKAAALVQHIRQVWQGIHQQYPPRNILYLIWQDPLMVVGADTYIDAVLTELGLINLGKGLSGRYPSLSPEELVALEPEEVWLSSEPFPFKAQHLSAFQHMLPNAKIRLVDGEMFSWYGSRMAVAGAYFQQWLHELS